VVLDDEVEEMRRPRLRRRVERLAAEGLLDVAEDRGELVATLVAEEPGSISPNPFSRRRRSFSV